MPGTGEVGEVAYLTAAEVQAIHVVVMEATDQSPAPLRDARLLEGAVRRPEMAAHYAGADLYEQAALLAVAISQAQAFADGNKRTAIAACRAFLHRNGRPFRRTNPALFRTLVDAAEARDVGRRLALATLARLLREGCAAGPESGRPGR
jgi:death on curing protein